jgi:hypothetical protein
VLSSALVVVLFVKASVVGAIVVVDPASARVLSSALVVALFVKASVVGAIVVVDPVIASGDDVVLLLLASASSGCSSKGWHSPQLAAQNHNTCSFLP